MILQDYIHRWVRADPLKFHGLHADMISARIGMTLEQYLWRAIRVAALSGILFAVIGYFSSAYLSLQVVTGKAGIANVFNFQMPVFFNFIYPAICMQALVVIVSFVIGIYIGYIVMLKLPGIEKNNRSIKINPTLHNAVAYMYAMRRGGAQLMTIFRSLSDRANIYGEVALEFRQIVRDADFFGYDVVSAIRHLSETTPSEKLKNFLEDLLSVIESGGDMGEFLNTRVRMYQEEARFEQRQFLNVLSIVAESYVTLFVAGPLFLIIIMVVMGMMGGPAVLQLALVTYAIMPIGSLVFILLIDLISIKAERTERYVRTKWLHTHSDVSIVRKPDEEHLFVQLKMYDRLRSLVHHLKHPLESFISNVNHTFYITVPVAILFLVMVLVRMPRYQNPELFIGVVDDYIVIALLIILIPYAIFYEIWSRKVLGIHRLHT
jgi:flagellar protein FlaJ